MKLKYELEEGAWAPYRAHKDDAGADLTANEDAILTTASPTVVHTGVHLLIPAGYVGRNRRSRCGFYRRDPSNHALK